MLFVRFQLGDDAYAIAARQVVEILPVLLLKQLPSAPQGAVGLVNYRGQPLPVVDLSLMALGRPSAHRLSTRILVVHSSAPEEKQWGLMVERANSVFSAQPEQFRPSGITLDHAPFLGPVLCGQGMLVQWIQPEQILTPVMQQALFS